MQAPLPHILCVDDEPNLLAGIKRQLRSQYQIDEALNANAALELINKNHEYEVIISDMRMPQMDGATFLAKAKSLKPNTVRILLTGQADIPSAIAAINEGGIFRFLTKPTNPQTLMNTINDAVAQHRLIIAEQELLEKTLHGSIKTLLDILSLTHAKAFGRSQKMLSYLKQIAVKIPELRGWQNEIACMLSQIGFLTLPPEIFEHWYQGNKLKLDEEHMLQGMPVAAIKLIEAIPRLDEVKNILYFQNKNYDGSSLPADSTKEDQIPLGSRAIKLLSDFETLQHQSYDNQYIVGVMQARKGVYDPKLLQCLIEILGGRAENQKFHECSIANLKVGMYLAEDVLSQKRQLLIPKGQEVTPVLIERLRNFSQNIGVREPLRLKVDP